MPQATRGSGNTKAGLCPICLQDSDGAGEDGEKDGGKNVWLSLKFSAYKWFVPSYTLCKVRAELDADICCRVIVFLPPFFLDFVLYLVWVFVWYWCLTDTPLARARYDWLKLSHAVLSRCASPFYTFIHPPSSPTKAYPPAQPNPSPPQQHFASPLAPTPFSRSTNVLQLSKDAVMRAKVGYRSKVLSFVRLRCVFLISLTAAGGLRGRGLMFY